jgi:hypothetical protein
MCSKPSPIHEAKPQASASSPLMSLDAFEDCLDRHGADLAHWPADLAAAGKRLMAENPLARASWHDAGLLDDFLTTRSEASAQPDLVEKILARQQALPMDVIAAHPLRSRWQAMTANSGPAMLCAAFALFGVAAGIFAHPGAISYDVSSIYLICTDVFYI